MLPAILFLVTYSTHAMTQAHTRCLSTPVHPYTNLYTHASRRNGGLEDFYLVGEVCKKFRWSALTPTPSPQPFQALCTLITAAGACPWQAACSKRWITNAVWWRLGPATLHAPAATAPVLWLNRQLERAYRTIIASVMKHLHLLAKATLNHSRNY